MTHHCTVILHIAGSHAAVTVIFSLAFLAAERRWRVLGQQWCSINSSVAVVYTDSISGSTCPSGSREYCCRWSYRIVAIQNVIWYWSWLLGCPSIIPARVDRQIKRHAGHVSTWSTYNEFYYGNITSVMQGMFGASLNLHKTFAMRMRIIPRRHDSLCWVVWAAHLALSLIRRFLNRSSLCSAVSESWRAFSLSHLRWSLLSLSHPPLIRKLAERRHVALS